MALEPITRQEKIIAGQDLTPITRLEMFLKNFGGSGGSGGGGGGWFVVTVSADESGNIIADHYRDDIATAFEKGEMPIVKATFEGETRIYNLNAIGDAVATFHNVSLGGNPENADVFLQQCHITKENVSVSVRNIVAG